MSDEFSYFDLGSGLPLGDTNAVITAAEVGYDTEYSADTCVVKITFQPDDEGSEEQTQLYSIGKGWEPLAGGEQLANNSGKRVRINQQSNYGKWINAAIGCEGFLDHAREVGLEPDSMALWIGTYWHLSAATFEVKNPSKPNEPAKERTIILPDTFHGIADGEGEATPTPAPVKAAAKKVAAKKVAAPAAKATAKPAAATTAASDVLTELAAEDGGEELIAALRELAGTCEDLDAFMEQAMDIEGVAGNKLAEKAVMSSKPGSIWADREG